jgi:hypothetical protein
MLLTLPPGSFRGSVRVLYFPAQEITIRTVDDLRGEITLRGALNAKDDFFLERVEGKSRVALGQVMQNTLRRAHAEMVDIEFDEANDRGVATVRLPIVGNKRVILKRLA